MIVDAYSNPYLASDLAIFDDAFGLPDPVLKIVAPQGVPAFDFGDEAQTGWASEIALDVQWAHAIAPAAKIVLVEARSDDDADILAATKYAVDHNLGDVISQSFGEGETCVYPKILVAQHRLFQRATAKGITLIAASGDDGATQPRLRRQRCGLQGRLVAGLRPARARRRGDHPQRRRQGQVQR